MLYRSLLGRAGTFSRLSKVAVPGSMSAHPATMGSASHIPLINSEFSSWNTTAVGVAGSPLFVTDLSKPFDFSEIQFVLSEQVRYPIVYIHIHPA